MIKMERGYTQDVQVAKWENLGVIIQMVEDSDMV